MAQLRTPDSEMFNTLHTVMSKARDITVDKVNTAQEAMLNLRIDWESLETTLRSRKIDGFEPAVTAMQQLAATAIAMASVMQSKIINQRIKQMEQEDVDVVAEELSAARQFAVAKKTAPKPPAKSTKPRSARTPR